MALRNVRIINRSDARAVSPNLTDVYDGDTGEKLLNVYRVELSAERGVLSVIVELGAGIEYEGPAEVRRVPVKADGTTEPVEEPKEATVNVRLVDGVRAAHIARHLASVLVDAQEAKEVLGEDHVPNSAEAQAWSLLDDIYGAADTALKKLTDPEMSDASVREEG